MAYVKQGFVDHDQTKPLKAEQLILMEDAIIEAQGQKRPIASSRTCPVVTFIYDDGPHAYDKAMVEKLDARGLKASFAVMGNIDPANWAGGTLLREWAKNGHNTLGHGVVSGAKVSGVGIGDMNDEETHYVIQKNSEALEYYGLNHRGLVYFNSMSYVPHYIGIVTQYYDYAIVNSGNGLNDFDRSNLQLNRYNTDGSAMLENALAAVDKALGTPVWLMFGGHTARTGQGTESNGYSTEEDVDTLLDYIADKVATGQMIALNADDAYDLQCARKVRFNVVQKLDDKYDLFNPMVGMTRYSGGLKYCSNKGTKAVYAVEFDASSATEGSFDLVIGDGTSGTEPGTYQTCTIPTTAASTAQSIMADIAGGIFKAYTVRVNKGKLYLYRDLPDETFTPYITNNTSGVAATVTEVSVGAAPTWASI